MRLCEIPGCERPHRRRGWCSTHYSRWRETGHPLGANHRSPLGDNLVHRFDEINWRPCGGNVDPVPPHRCERCGAASDSVAVVPADWKPGVRMA